MTHRHIEDDNGGDEANTGASDQTASNHDTKAGGSRLEYASNGEDSAAGDDGHAASNEIGAVTGNDGTEEGATRQDRSRQRLIARRQVESGNGSFIIGVWVRKARILANEVFHGQDAGHPAGVISKEDTAKGSKGAEEVGLEGNGCFYPRGIGRARDHSDSASRHDCDVEDVVRRVCSVGEVLQAGRGKVIQAGGERRPL